MIVDPGSVSSAICDLRFAICDLLGFACVCLHLQQLRIRSAQHSSAPPALVCVSSSSVSARRILVGPVWYILVDSYSHPLGTLLVGPSASTALHQRLFDTRRLRAPAPILVGPAWYNTRRLLFTSARCNTRRPFCVDNLSSTGAHWLRNLLLSWLHL